MPASDKYWRQRRVMVTGASGFIGSALLTRLAELDAIVYPTTRAGKSPTKEFAWLNLDLTDTNSIHGALSDITPDIIFHLAGSVTGNRKIEAIPTTLRANLVSTVNLLEAATRHDVPIVISGSLEETSVHELAGGASSPYSLSKWAVTEYAALFSRLYGTNVTVLRIGMTYGPREKTRSRLVPYVIDSLLAGERPRLTSGSRRVDWIYVDDVVDSLILTGEQEAWAVGPFDVGSGVSTSIRETAMLIVQLLDSPIRPTFGAIEDRPADRDWVADVSTTTKGLGWRPQTSLSAGLVATIHWHRRTVT